MSKHIHLLEQELRVRLLLPTTRRVTVTEDGKRTFQWAQRILDDLDQLVQVVSRVEGEPHGLLHVSSSFRFGCNMVAPEMAQLVCLVSGRFA